MRVFDTGIYQDKYPFVVAEYLPDTLGSVIARGTTSITPKIAYTLQLLSALDYLAEPQASGNSPRHQARKHVP